jgi:hypothetical protein
MLEMLFLWFSLPGYKSAAINLQRVQAEAVADKIGAFITATTSQVGWTLASDRTIGQRRFDALRLLREVHAITTFRWLDSSGWERLTQSKLSTCYGFECPPTDFSRAPEFTVAMEKNIYYGPVYFRREIEPYMTLSLAGTRRDAGVSVAEVNLRFIWEEVVSQIQRSASAATPYLVDTQGRLIAHPDVSLLLHNMTQLPQVAAARAAVSAGAGAGPSSGVEDVEAAKDIRGREVFTTYAPITPPGWLVFVDLPVQEAYKPLYFAMERSFGPLLAVLALVFFGIAWLSSPPASGPWGERAR